MNKKQIALIVSLVVISLIALIGTSYAIFTKTLEGKKAITVSMGTLKVDFTEGNKINLENAAPMSDSKGLKSTPYTFTVSNNGTIDAYYKVYFEEDSTNSLDKNLVKYSLTSSDGFTSGVKTVGADGIDLVPSTKIIKKGTVTYTLRMWLSSEADNSAQGKSYGSKIVVESSSSDMETITEKLLKDYTNPLSITTYTAGDKTMMYTFQQTAGVEQKGYTSKDLIDYRYIGSTPNNYIFFNDELWRIIGIFTVEDRNGNKEQRVKIIRNESIGSFAYDNSTTVNSSGQNYWGDARLMKLFNGGYESEAAGGSLYWNKKSGRCYSGQSNGTTSCDFTTTGLTDSAKSMIAETKWYLGGNNQRAISMSNFYQFERGTNVTNSKPYPQNVSWIGHVGLMYPSDYGYTFAMGVENSCYTNISNCYTSNGANPNSSWLYTSSIEWFISPFTYVSYQAYSHSDMGGVYYSNVTDANISRPSVYLKSSLRITSGTGMSSDPFILT